MASLADAKEALRSTTTKANFQRLTRLLMCGGLRLLRETFDSIHSPADLPLKLCDPTTKTQLRGARLTTQEKKCLNPSPGVYGKSTDFDITLIFKLLRTICNLTPPPGPRGWDDLPNSSDYSLEADLVRIKYYRNEVYAHSKTMEITDTEFNDLWGKISQAMIRIAAAISHEKKDELKKSIYEFLFDALTPEEERYIEELNTWYKQDMDVKSEVEKLKEELKTQMSDVKEDQKKMYEEVVKQSQLLATLLLKIKAESGTQAGSPIISNQPSGRAQTPQEAGESRGICAMPIPDLERTENDVSVSGELQLNPLNSPTDIQIWSVIISFKKSFELFFQYLAYKLDVFAPKHDLGSLLITVQCSSLPILEGLWEDYCSGHLNAIAQEMLVTAEVLEKLDLADVRLNTFISEEEYEKGKQIIMDHSAISGQSRLPPGDAAGKSASRVEAGKDAVSEFVLGDVPEELTTPIQKEKDTGDDSGHEPRVKEAAKEKFPKTESVESEWLALQSKPELENLPLAVATTTSIPSASSEGHEPDVKEAAKEKFTKTESVESERLTLQRKPELETPPLAVATTTSIPSASSEDYLERISILEEENRELKRRLIAIEDKLQGNKESRKIKQLEMKYIQLEEELLASKRQNIQLEKMLRDKEIAKERSYSEVQEMKDRVDYLEELFNAEGFQSFRDDPFLRRAASRRPSLRERLSSPISGVSFNRIKGFCQVIINRQQLEALDKEKMEFESVFKDLGFHVDEKVCESNDDVELVIKSVATRDYSDYNRFICFIQSSVTKDGKIESFLGRSMSVTKLLAKFRFLKFSSLREAPKIFIIQGNQTTTALEADEPIDEKSVSMKLPVGETLSLFFPYREGYISTLLSVIKLSVSKPRDILDILSEAKKLFYEESHITIPEPVHNLTGPVYLK